MRHYTDLVAQIGLWIEDNPGIFTSRQIDDDLGLSPGQEKKYRSIILNRLAQKGIIRKEGGQSGKWVKRETDLEILDLSKEDTPVNMPLPLGLNDLVEIYPRDIILIAGAPNAGKTTMALWIAHEYARQSAQSAHQSVHYFNSETTAPGLKRIIKRYPMPELFYGEGQKIMCYSRNDNFADVIFRDGLNIVDYLELHDNFYLVGDMLKSIHDHLGDGIAVVCVQRKPGAAYAKGGAITLEKPRLVINLEANPPHGYICKIVKAKNWKTDTNPNALEIDFYLKDGWDFVPKSDWRYVSETDRVKINNAYLKEKDGVKGYAFTFTLTNGKKAGLNFEDLEQWREAYPYIDVDILLNDVQKKRNGNAWLSPKGWFFQLSAYLNKLNSKAKEEKHARN